MALLVVIPSVARAQTGQTDLSDYKLRITGFWLYSTPTVSVEAAGHNGLIQFDRDFGFNEYSTFLGGIDWKFTRKNHLYFNAARFDQSNGATLARTITFRGQTYNVGANANGKLEARLYAPGYRYDIIRRRRGHLGIGVQINIFQTTGSISAAAQVTGGGVPQFAASSSASVLAPIPVAGPEFRFYLTKSQRLFVDGNFMGMYFFGYGNFASTTDFLGLTLSRHFSITGGYALGSRLRVNDTSNRVGLNLDQRGPIAGLQVSF